MVNYSIWECEYDSYDSDKMVQVFNKSDLPSIQEQFVKQGYFIRETFIGKDGDYFFVIRKFELE